MKRRVVIVGGGYAGVLCALRLARKTRRSEVDILLVSARPWFVERIRLHEDVAGEMRRRTPLETMLRGSGVHLRIGHVAGIDTKAQLVHVEDTHGGSEAFDELILAVGSIASVPPFMAGQRIARDGIVHTCATEEGAMALRDRLAKASDRARGLPTNVLVVGGGLTGIELATELGERRSDLRITLATSGEIAPMLGANGRNVIRHVLAKHGIETLENECVAAVDDDGATLGSGRALPSDVVVWCGGLAPTSLARNAGLDVDLAGRAIVDAHLRSTSHPFIRVIGDAASASVPGTDGSLRPLRMACATAMPMGAFCADDVARGGAPFAFGYAAICMSLGRKHGAVQRVDASDRAIRGRLDGRLGAWFKEAVCRSTTLALELERRHIAYRWPQGAKRAPAQLASRTASLELTP